MNDDNDNDTNRDYDYDEMGFSFIGNNPSFLFSPSISISFLIIILFDRFYSYTACSDPGIIFIKEGERDEEAARIQITPVNPIDLSDNLNHNNNNNSLINNTPNNNNNNVNNNNNNSAKVECGLCHIDRPRNAFHCHECGVCVLDLDHHCPVRDPRLFLFLILFLTSFCCSCYSDSGRGNVSDRRLFALSTVS
jgi:hypothetical protein